MIEYSFGTWGVAFVWSRRGSVFHKAALWALPSAGLTVGLGILMDSWWEPKIDIEATMLVWNSFTFILGFLLVFRTQLAYSRFWEGATLLQHIGGVWFNATSNLFAFCSEDPAKNDEVESFQHLLVRLMSLLHCSALQEIAQMRNENFEVLGFAGINPESLEHLSFQPDRCKTILQWIQRLTVTCVNNKVITVAPPIVSRVYQELSIGIVDVQSAKKIAEIPFPFPYAQMLSLMLMLQTAFTPIAVALLNENYYVGGLVCFMCVLTPWSINYIAAELEVPFGDDPNDLPIDQMQKVFNRNLKSLMSPLTHEPPGWEYNKIIHDNFEGRSLSVEDAFTQSVSSGMSFLQIPNPDRIEKRSKTLDIVPVKPPMDRRPPQSEHRRSHSAQFAPDRKREGESGSHHSTAAESGSHHSPSFAARGVPAATAWFPLEVNQRVLQMEVGRAQARDNDVDQDPVCATDWSAPVHRREWVPLDQDMAPVEIESLPACGAAHNFARCTSCGHIFEAQAAFCSSCGERRYASGIPRQPSAFHGNLMPVRTSGIPRQPHSLQEQCETRVDQRHSTAT